MAHISNFPDVIETVKKLDAAGLSLTDIIRETGIGTNKVSQASIYNHAKPEQWYDGMAMDEVDLAQRIMWMRDKDAKSWERIAVYGGLPSPQLARRIYEKYTGTTSRGPYCDGRGRPRGSRRSPRPAGYDYKGRNRAENFLVRHGFNALEVHAYEPEKLRAYQNEVRKDLRQVWKRGLHRYWE